MSRILIVEDEERIALFLEKGLRANGFATTVGRGPLTAAADVWGMGATLYHAAVGRPPFRAPAGGSGDRFPQLRDAPERLPATVAPAVAGLVLACLETAPAARPEPHEVAAELEQLVDALPRRPVLSRFRVRPRVWE